MANNRLTECAMGHRAKKICQRCVELNMEDFKAEIADLRAERSDNYIIPKDRMGKVAEKICHDDRLYIQLDAGMSLEGFSADRDVDAVIVQEIVTAILTEALEAIDGK